MSSKGIGGRFFFFSFFSSSFLSASYLSDAHPTTPTISLSSYIKCIYVYNKIDVCSIEEVDALARLPRSIPVSAREPGALNMDRLLEAVWDAMALVRVYTKKAGGRPDFSEPVVLSADRGGTEVRALCDHVHRAMAGDLAHALVWGASAKHYPQRAGLAHGLADEDVVQLVKSKVATGGDDGRGRFKTASSKPARIGDREKKAALRT